jgi:hypothetical protein
MIRSLLAALVALPMLASADEWRYWTWPGEARMAAATGRTAWFATSGGVLEWNLDANTSRLHQLNDGLPSTNLVSIVAQSDGSVWTVSGNGNLAVKRPDKSFWESKGTYAAKPNPWAFTPRAMGIHRNTRTGREVLVMGGSQGLTFYPADSGVTLDWVDQFGTLGKREVRSIHIEGDTVWVGLMGGMARIVPPWDSLGNNRAFVGDPKRWTILAKSAETDSYDALFPTPAGLTWQRDFQFGAKDILVAQSLMVWKDRVFATTNLEHLSGNKFLYPAHALEIPTGLLVSSSNSDPTQRARSKGALFLKPDGTFLSPPSPTNSYPTSPPIAVSLESSGRITAWSNNQVFRRDSRQLQWTSPWDRRMANNPFLEGADLETIGPRDLNNFSVAPNGSVWVGFWGFGLWGALPRKGSDSLQWVQWMPDNSCLEGADPDNPNAANFPVMYSTIATATETWSILGSVSTRLDSLKLVRASLSSDSAPTCYKFATASNTPHSGLLARQDHLWVGSQEGLLVLNRPKPSETFARRVRLIPGDVRRLGVMSLDGQDVIVAMGPSEVRLISEKRPDSTIASSIRQTSPVAVRQEWKSMAIDGIGQIWLAGSAGIDLMTLEFGPAGWEFRKVREITTQDGLPSDNIYHLSLDPSTGIAVVATDAGLGHWASPYRPLPSRLETKKARVWPNPYRTRSHKELVVDGATQTSEFFLHAADGTLVLHLGSEAQNGGYFRWATPPTDRLRPGVYRWTLKDGSRTVGGPLLISE